MYYTKSVHLQLFLYIFTLAIKKKKKDSIEFMEELFRLFGERLIRLKRSDSKERFSDESDIATV